MNSSKKHYKVYTVPEAAERLGITKARVYQLISAGDLRAQRVNVGKGRWPCQMVISAYSLAAHDTAARKARGVERRARPAAERLARAKAELAQRVRETEAWAAEQTRLRLEREVSGTM